MMSEFDDLVAAFNEACAAHETSVVEQDRARTKGAMSEEHEAAIDEASDLSAKSLSDVMSYPTADPAELRRKLEACTTYYGSLYWVREMAGDYLVNMIEATIESLDRGQPRMGTDMGATAEMEPTT